MNPKANLRQSIRARLTAAHVKALTDPALATEPASVAAAPRVQLNQQLGERLVRLFQSAPLFRAPTVTPIVTSATTKSSSPESNRESEPQVWAAFLGHGYEPDLKAPLRTLSAVSNQVPQAQIEWVFPRVLGPEMDFYRVAADHRFIQNDWSLFEPDPQLARKIEPDEISGFLIPGLAFDQSGRRLGRGRGYYDRYLARLAQSLSRNLKTKIGIAFDQQILKEDLPMEPHDFAMDIVLSETRCLISNEWLSHWTAGDAGILMRESSRGNRSEHERVREGLSAAISGAEFFNSTSSNFSSHLSGPSVGQFSERTKL